MNGYLPSRRLFNYFSWQYLNFVRRRKVAMSPVWVTYIYKRVINTSTLIRNTIDRITPDLETCTSVQQGCVGRLTSGLGLAFYIRSPLYEHHWRTETCSCFLTRRIQMTGEKRCSRSQPLQRRHLSGYYGWQWWCGRCDQSMHHPTSAQRQARRYFPFELC